MKLVENKKLFIENKKKDLEPAFLKHGLGSLFIAVNDVYERLNNGFNNIMQLNSIDDLYVVDGRGIVAIDIRDKEYSAELDNIAYAKRLNEDICVVVKDIILEEYQLYLSNMYNIDGIIFDVENISPMELKNIVYLAKIMGIELIYSLKSQDDLNKLKEYWDIVRFIAPFNNKLIDIIPKTVKIVKDAGSSIDKEKSDVLIIKKEV